MESIYTCLPQLQSLFATDFSDVRFLVSDLPDRLGARAFAYGNEIYLRPDILVAEERGRLALLAHELTHVVQFRRGRIPGGGLIIDDPELECEAEIAAAAALGEEVTACEMDLLRWSAPLVTSRERQILCRPDCVTNKWFGGKFRPDWAGNVVIHFEDLLYVNRTITRPVGVHGLIAPGSTAGRGQAPEPICGWRVSTAASVPKRFKYDPATGLNARNTGMIDAEKGHIMALELGGPDIEENIVPQWAKWQGSGEWRAFEKELEKEARKVMKTKDRFLMFHCVVHYFTGFENVRLTSERKLCVPVGFSVFAPVIEKQSDGSMVVASTAMQKTLYQHRNETDDMMALRSMEGVEQEEDASFSMADEYDDVVGKKRKNRTTLGFGKTGQDARYGPPPVQFRPVLTPYLQTVGNQFSFNSTVANATPAPTPARRIVKAKRRGAGGMDTT